MPRHARLWFAAAVLLHLVTAYRSEGFFYPDEHFQILEFMNAYLGRSPYADLPWEYSYHMREWVQPWLFAQLSKLFEWFGISSPFTWVLLYRLISACLGLGVLWGLIVRLPGWIGSPGLQKWVVIGLCTLWVVVFRDVRPSSESWSGDFFAFALLLSIGDTRSEGNTRWVGVGVLLGLAFELRYPTAPAIVGLGLWHLIIRRTPLRRAVPAAAGFVAAVLFALVIDRLGYGAWRFPPWDFVYQNLIVGKAASFSDQPWWWYLARFSAYLPPLSTVLLVLSLAGFAVRRTHVLTWSLVPFVLVHFLLADKQIRFFFPVIAFVPVLCGFAAEWIGRMWARGAAKAWRVLKPVLVAENAAALAVVALSVCTLQVPFWRIIYERLEAHPDAVVYSSVKGLYVKDLKIHYYRPPAIDIRAFQSWSHVRRALARGETALVLVGYKDGLWTLNPAVPALHTDCRLLHTTVPVWLMKQDLSAYGWIHRRHWWALYECAPGGSRGSPRG